MSNTQFLVSEKTEQIERLMPSLLAKAFRGELVSQEAGDEDGK